MTNSPQNAIDFAIDTNNSYQFHKTQILKLYSSYHFNLPHHTAFLLQIALKTFSLEFGLCPLPPSSSHSTIKKGKAK